MIKLLTLVQIVTEERLGIIDRMNEHPAVNEMFCRCGRQLFPDCDVSSASIVEEFERHLLEVHLIVVSK